MVFLHFPSKLTEEELMLQAKYAKLRKKKKQVAAHQNPSKVSEAEKSILSSSQNRYFRDYLKIQPNLTL
jgi:negative elongation factor E